MPPHRNVMPGDVVFVRGEVLQIATGCFQVRFADYPEYVVTAWVPARECAKAEDIGRLRPATPR